MKKKLMGLFCVGLLASVGLGVATIGGAAAAPAAQDLIMVQGASVRYAGKGETTNYSGIRFASYVRQDYRKNNPDNEIGMLLIPTELLNGRELTASVENVSIARAEVIVSLDTTDDLYREGYDCFKTVLYNIPAAYYGKQLSARAYVKEGERYTPIGETQVRSMAQVAWSAYQDPKNGDKLEELGGYLTNVEITAPETLALHKGDEQALGATVNYEGLSPKYKSNDTSVATVSADGKIKAVGDGETTVTTTVGKKVKTTAVTVTTAPPIAESDPEYTFWSFEDGSCLPNGASYYTSSANTSEGRISVAANNDSNRTKSLKMVNYWDWIGFKGAQFTLPTGAITDKIAIRIKANEDFTLAGNLFYFDGIKGHRPTNESVAITTEWQEITLTFANDITSVTGFQIEATKIPEGNAIYIDYFALTDVKISSPIAPTDPENTFWSFEDENAHPNGAGYYTGGNANSASFIKVVSNEGANDTHALKLAGGASDWIGFTGATTASVPTVATNKIVVRIRADANITFGKDFYFDGNVHYPTSQSFTITTEWQEITFAFSNDIERITGFQLNGLSLPAGNAIYIDWFVFGELAPVNPIAPTDPENTFWSFEDQNSRPNGTGYYTGGNADSANFISVVESGDASDTCALKLKGGASDWIGFTGATTAAVPVITTNKIVIRIKADANITFGKDFYFDGNVHYPTSQSFTITTEWQEITFAFSNDIERITGFQINGLNLPAGNAIYIDWFAFGEAA